MALSHTWLLHKEMRASVQTADSQKRPRLFKRQLRLLALLHALGGPIGKTDFQKMLFLYCQEQRSSDRVGTSLYEFVPYKLGAFSFTCDADLHRLRRYGLLCNGERWNLTAEGNRMGRTHQDRSVHEFVCRYAEKRGPSLIQETYRRFPYYATRSEKVGSLLKNEPVAMQLVRAAKPKATGATLLTVGYEGRMLEEYFNLLLRSNVTILCDVRRNPISRKYGFSKSMLSQTCDRMDICYKHLPELGIEARDRRGLRTQVEFQALFRTYTQRIRKSQDKPLADILTWLRSGEIVALTCYEHEPSQCHRHCVAAALEDFSEQSEEQIHTVTHL